MTGYDEITKLYRLARRELPQPHKSLNRRQAVLFRQLQTRTLPNPAVLHKVYPDAYPDDKCKVFRDERATMEHILWDCKKHPDEARRRIFPPSLEWATRTEDQETQLKAIQRVIEALARQGLGEPEKASRDTCRRAKKTT